MGRWIDSVWSRWSVQNCPSLARNISGEDDLVIYFDCGKQDETLAYAFNTSFADSLDKLGLIYEFQSFTGGHYDRNTRYPIGLRFLDSAMNTIVGILDKETTGPATYCLSQNYPNPFNPLTSIHYELPSNEAVTIGVYNAVGQEIEQLVDKKQEAGYYTVQWDGSEQASGIYVLRFEAGTYQKNMKMILLK